MDDADVVVGFDGVGFLASVAPSEDVHLNAHGAEVVGQLPDVYVHPSCLALANKGVGASVEAHQGHSLDAQLLFTTMRYRG